MSNRNEDDDDVSVLTFHTLGTKDTGASPGEWSARSDDKKSYVREEGIKKTLSHISEESQNSGELKNAKSEDSHDDESMSLAESVLDSTNKLLSSIGSSSYYSGLNARSSQKEKRLNQETFSPPPKPNTSHPSPMKSYTPRKVFGVKEEKVISPCNKSMASVPPEKSIFGQLKVNNEDNYTSCIKSDARKQQSYFDDEPNENSNKLNYNETSNQKEKESFNSKKGKLRKMEAETKQLQLLLKEKQLETKLAMSELDASIERANALLK